MTERGLRISEVNGWELDKLGLDATSLGRLVTKLEGALQSMLIEQDDLAESWNGPGASAAADRVVNEKTAGSHICAKIDDIKDLLAGWQSWPKPDVTPPKCCNRSSTPRASRTACRPG